MTEPPDEVMAKAGEVLSRATDTRLGAGRLAPPPQRARPRRMARRLAVGTAAEVAIVFAAIVIGLLHPLGIFGALAVLAVMLAVPVLLLLVPAERAPAPEQLRTSDLKSLPRQTERWLAAQRPALPAPAITLVDQIAVRLDQLAPQLATLDEHAPAAEEVRKLVAEQLPEFVRGYQKVPANLRGVPRNGKTPDAQLVDGLQLIERQIGEVSDQLAQGDLDSLATRGRYLEIKYQGDGTTA